MSHKTIKEIVSFSISPCRKFIAIIEAREYLIISSVASGKVLCSSNIHSKASEAPLGMRRNSVIHENIEIRPEAFFSLIKK